MVRFAACFFAVQYAIKRIQINQGGLKLNVTHKIPLYADDVHILGGRVRTIKKNAVLLIASKENGLEVNAGKTRYMKMYGQQDAGRSHSMKNDNSSFERVEQFKYLGTTVTNHNCIREEIKSRLNSANICYRSVQILLSSRLLSKNLKIKI